MIHGRKIFRREAHLMDVHMLLNDEKGAGYSFLYCVQRVIIMI